MFSRDDTIAAIATPPGRGGLGVIRISGPDASAIALRLLNRSTPLPARMATLASVVDPVTRRSLDQVVATFFQAPASFTGDHVVEISAHGSPVVLRQILERVLDAGARLAEPGEFTLRAYLNGRIDLVQAEAVADLVAAVTPLQARAACDQLQGTLTEAIGALDAALFDLTARLEASIDFPEEHYHFVGATEAARELRAIEMQMAELLCQARRGRLVRDGLSVAIAGTPNVGKSSLFNALVGSSRAIVTATPGTTRDLVTETVEIDGVSVTLVDTAGIRNAADEIEREGMARAHGARDAADVAIEVLDR
jgi:tRNA modification GTPase